MNLGFDMDEVIIDLVDGLLIKTNKEFGLNLKKEQLTTYNFEDLPLSPKVSEFFVKTAHDPNFLLSARPYPSAIHAIKYLKNTHKIYFITARRKSNAKITKKWLEKYNVPYDRLIVSGGSAQKGLYANKLELDFFLDDRIKSLNAMQQAKQNWKIGLFVFDRPWNRYTEEFARFHDWNEIVDYFKQLKGKVS